MIRSDSFSSSNSVGLYHAENQDSFLDDPKNLLFAVADGVGGYSGAKEASLTAVDSLRSLAGEIHDEASFKSVVFEIHERIRRRSYELGFENMGTTLAAVKVLDLFDVLCLNVGDSPILHYSHKTIEAAYVDDSHRELDRSAMFGITQYLGLECDLEIHLRRIRCSKDDVLLLCSDGITDNLSSFGSYDELARLMLNHPRAEEIVKLAMKAGVKPDDMTCLLVYF
ncbi:MAG: serine/threonine-protein phosphatase [Thaumarchaeota archaeon]|nr:serine/threonine-protein phosphatase [Nitrososphaerota archaeon]